MPILRSDLGPWIPGPGAPVPFLTWALTAWAAEAWAALGLRGRAGQGRKDREKPTAAYTGAREGDRQGPSSQRRVNVGCLLTFSRGGSRARPAPAQPRAWCPPWGPGRTEAQGGRQMGQREMRSQGHPKATDSNAPGEGGPSAPPGASSGEGALCPPSPSSSSRRPPASRGCCRS